MKIKLSLVGLVAVLLLVSWRLSAQPPPEPSHTPVPPVTVSQAEATRPGVPPASVPPSQTLGWMFSLGVISNWVLKKVKDSPWFPMVKEGAGKINFAIAALLALGASLGIHTEFDPTAGSLLITGLSWSSIVHIGGDWIQQLALQQFTYQSMSRDVPTN